MEWVKGAIVAASTAAAIAAIPLEIYYYPVCAPSLYALPSSASPSHTETANCRSRRGVLASPGASAADPSLSAGFIFAYSPQERHRRDRSQRLRFDGLRFIETLVTAHR